MLFRSIVLIEPSHEPILEAFEVFFFKQTKQKLQNKKPPKFTKTDDAEIVSQVGSSILS